MLTSLPHALRCHSRHWLAPLVLTLTGAGLALPATAAPVRANFDKVTAIAAGDGFTLALREDGTVWT